MGDAFPSIAEESLGDKDTTTGLPINSVQPKPLVAGLGYDSANGRWGTELIVTLSGRKTDIDDSALQPRDPQAPAVQAFNVPIFLLRLN
ncbi:MAG: hypothetical protein L3J24_09850 [Xanthomonadales bacterium]|nr:hypothetical protein [Xanthomonadales bacterium]